MHAAIEGTWHNQHGSELDLAIDDEGVIRGLFRSRVGLSSPLEQSMVVGFATGDLVSFVAEFGHHDCLTAWAGHYLVQDGKECIEAWISRFSTERAAHALSSDRVPWRSKTGRPAVTLHP